MKVVIAIDSFKGSLSSIKAGNAAKEGILYVYPEAQVVVKALADGGEGTVGALADAAGCVLETITVHGPLGEPVKANYAILQDKTTAVIEMAQAAGLTLVQPPKRDPRLTTTYGVGEIIKRAIAEGCRSFIIGIGGSATNDAGIGMLQALGFEFLDAQGQAVQGTGGELGNIVQIKTDNCLPELAACNFKIACDVNNPLYGVNGAAYIYGPQKGANQAIIKELDANLLHFAKLVQDQLGKDVAHTPGAGAAGGLGYAFLVFLNAQLESGIKIILEEIRLAELVRDADVVITGEGRLDAQTAMGKAPIGVAKLAKQYGVKVIALSGCTTDDALQCNQAGIDAYFAVVNSAMSMAEAMREEVAYNNVKQTTIQIFNLLKACGQ